MRAESALKEIVLFELPGVELAELFIGALAAKRHSWVEIGDAASVVGVLLAPDPMDFAVLLRRVQSWLDRSGLLVIRFEVDGRTYVLESAAALGAAALERTLAGPLPRPAAEARRERFERDGR